MNRRKWRIRPKSERKAAQDLESKQVPVSDVWSMSSHVLLHAAAGPAEAIDDQA